jgi:hypothetical protein
LKLLPDHLRTELERVPIAQLAEYVCSRVQLDSGRTMLQLQFIDGRYDRMRRLNMADPPSR